METYNSSFTNFYNQSLFINGLLMPLQGTVNKFKTPYDYNYKNNYR